MTAVFETPRFRVHIMGKTAWVENKESAGWVLQAQVAIPVSPESLANSREVNVLTAALLDFESAQRGDTSLRAVLTGSQPPRQPRIPSLERAQVSRATRIALVSRKRNGGQFWERLPLRPPLLSKPLNTVESPRL